MFRLQQQTITGLALAGLFVGSLAAPLMASAQGREVQDASTQADSENLTPDQLQMLGALGQAATIGRIAVVNIEVAIIQTDEAQQRLTALRETEDYKADKADLEQLIAERDELYKELERDLEVMNLEQQQEARKRLTNKNADLQHVSGKLEQAEQELRRELLSEMLPKVQVVLPDLVTSGGIGLLIRGEAVLHANNGYSITAKLTDKLNQHLAGLAEEEE